MFCAFACAGVGATSAFCVPVRDVLVVSNAAGDGAADAVGAAFDDVEVSIGVPKSRYVGARMLGPVEPAHAEQARGLLDADLPARLAYVLYVVFPRRMVRRRCVVFQARTGHYWPEFDQTRRPGARLLRVLWFYSHRFRDPGKSMFAGRMVPLRAAFFALSHRHRLRWTATVKIY